MDLKSASTLLSGTHLRRSTMLGQGTASPPLCSHMLASELQLNLQSLLSRDPFLSLLEPLMVHCKCL